MAAGQLDFVLRHLRHLLGRQAVEARSDGQLLDRFLTERDEEAFSILMDRHGPMVLSVCRRILGDGPDADDAFQATFLVLVRRAREIDRRGSLGSWLYGVAHKIATRAKADAARRNAREKQGFDMALLDHAADRAWTDLRPVLDDELSRLPEKYRSPLILCYLQGKTNEQAALELGWPVGSMSRRLARGRELLRQRLVNRGITLSAGLLAGALAGATATASVPATLAQTTMRAAVLLGAGQAAGVASVHVWQLVEAATHMVWLTKTKVAVAAVLALTLAAGGTGVWVYQLEKNKSDHSTADKAQAREIGRNEKTPSQPHDQESAREPPQQEIPAAAPGLPFGALMRFGSQVIVVDEDKPSATDIAAVALSANGRYLAVLTNAKLSKDARIILWDLQGGKKLQDAKRQGKRQERRSQLPFHFSLDGERLITPDGVFDRQSGRALHLWSDDEIQCTVVPNSDDRTFGVVDKRLILHLRRFDDGTKELESFPIKGLTKVHALAFAPDGESLAVAGEYKTPQHSGDTVDLYDVQNGRYRATVYQRTEEVTYLVFSPNGKNLFVGNSHGQVCSIALAKPEKTVAISFGQPVEQVWPGPEDNTFLGRYSNGGGLHLIERGKRKDVRDLSHFQFFDRSADGRTVAFATSGAVRVGPASVEEPFALSGGHMGPVRALAFSPDGRTLATGGYDGTLRLWDTATGDERCKAVHTQEAVRGVAFSPSGKRLAVEDSSLRQYDVRDLTNPRQMQSRFSTDDGFAYSPNGKELAVVVPGLRFSAYDAETGTVARPYDLQRAALPGGRCVAYSPDGKLLAVGSERSKSFLQPSEGLIGIWDATSGKLFREFGGHAGRSYGIAAVAFSPDGRYLAYAEGKTVALCDVTTGAEVRSFRGHDKSVTSLAYSPDGYTLASASEDATLRLWEVLTAREIKQFQGHLQSVYSVAYSPDGRRLASASADGTALAWQVYGPINAATPLKETYTEKELNDFWTSLSNDDASHGYQAVAMLAHAPKQSVPFLKERWKEYHVPDAKLLDQLKADALDELSPSHDKAVQELAELEDAAVDGVQKALSESPSEFVRKRLEHLLEVRKDGIPVYPSSQRLALRRSLLVLELIGNDDARAVLKSVSEGNPKDPVAREAKAALERLSRKGEEVRR